MNKPKASIQLVKDRPGHDFRYALNFSKSSKLGWKPEVGFEEGVHATVDWCKQNLGWFEKSY